MPALTVTAALLDSLKATAGTKNNLIGRPAIIHSKDDAGKRP